MNASSVYLLGHNGLGDNITMIGALRYLVTIYDKVYFICKEQFQKNVDDLLDCSSVITVPIKGFQEKRECKEILDALPPSVDVLISGACHRWYYASRISNQILLNYKQSTHNFKCDFHFIREFYHDIHLDLSIYYDWFHIPSSPSSLKLYETIQHKKIIFLHTKASNCEVTLGSIIEKYISDEGYFIVCANKNVYDPSSENGVIAASYVNLVIRDYIDIIKHANQLHVVNSCFSCIVHILVNSGKVTPEQFKIYDRNERC